MKNDSKQQKIIEVLFENSPIAPSGILSKLQENKEKISLITVKRILSSFIESNLVEVLGAGRATTYTLSVKGRLFYDINAAEYCSVEPDKRTGQSSYNFELFNNLPTYLLNEEEEETLKEDTISYWQRQHNLSKALKKKELERLIIELSWKSSKIEGNTYTLLDTEKLILENKAAAGKTEEETRMILNHKEAFNFVLNNAAKFKKLSRPLIEELHKKLVQGLDIEFKLRNKPVGITGSIYRPLDNRYQIGEALDSLVKAINKMDSAYDQALLAKIGIAYIQPFDDGNKRTGRLLANAILLANNLAPLSYRSVTKKNIVKQLWFFMN